MLSTFLAGSRISVGRNARMFIPIRHASSTESKPIQLNNNMTYRPAVGNMDQRDRPLVIIYGWLVAKAKHIHKYGDFYLGKGYDVLHVKITPTHMLKPVNAQDVVKRVLDFTLAPEHVDKNLLLHGFSIGSYLSGETHVHIQNHEQYRDIGRRLQGQILDSPADPEIVPTGFSRAITSSPLLQKTIQKSMYAYMSAFETSVTRHYRTSFQTACENKLNTPTLFLYSDADPVGAKEPIEELMAEWTARGIPHFSQCFAGSPHVSHFHHYPVEYIRMLNEFLVYIGFEKSVPQQQQQQQQKSSVNN